MSTIVKMIHGSHLYGLNTPASDTDYKGIVLPTKEQVLLGQANFELAQSTGDPHKKNTSEDVDTKLFSLQKFLKMAVEGETIVIDMLHASERHLLESSYLWEHIVDNRHKFYTKNMKAYLGYVRKQAAKYGVKGSRLALVEEVLELSKQYKIIDDSGRYHLTVRDLYPKLPVNEHAMFVETEHPSVGKQYFYELCGRKYQDSLKVSMFHRSLQALYDSYGDRAKAAKENEGIDWKSISHAYRAGFQLKYIYRDGGFEYPLPETQLLLDIKQGKLDFTTEIQGSLDLLLKEVEELAEKSSYPEKVDQKFVNNLVMVAHESIVKSTIL